MDINLISIRQLAKRGITIVCGKDEAVGTHEDGDVVFNSKVGSDVYYLETIPDGRCIANVSVSNDRSEVDDSNNKIEIIEAKAFRSVVS
jgi:hypothetical protein